MDDALVVDLRAEIAGLRDKLREHEENRRGLLHQQAALRTVIASIPYGVFWKDRSSRYLGCNDKFAALAGLSGPEVILGKTDYDMPWKKEESDFFRECDRRVIEDEEPMVDIEEPILGANGEQKFALTSKVPLRDDDQNVIGMLGIFADITARKRMELDLKRAHAEAEAADRAKGEFLATMSHELRTPLALILGPLGALCARGDLPKTAMTDLRRVQRSAWRLKGQIDDILDFAKADAGKVVAEHEPVDVAEAVSSVLQEVRSAAVARGIELSEGIEPSGVIAVDPRMLDKILLNLVGNALKFTPAGGHVRVQLAVEADGEEIELSVQDSGIGIAPADQERLFQRFHQVDSTSTRRYEGTGLGLALVKEFAGLMGGRVWVESELGVGSRFNVRLPRRLVQAEPGNLTPRAPEQHAAIRARLPGADHIEPITPASRVPEGGGVIVLAEDNAELRAYLHDLLSTRHKVIACADGAEALAAVARHAPDVIVSDVMMPEMDGNELVARVRATPALASTPVLLLTAHGGDDAVVSSLENGADDFLSKPFNPAELHARVEVALRLRRALRRVEDTNRDLLATRDMLVQAEKLAALGRLLAHLSHEINNPMTIILGNLEPCVSYLQALQAMLASYRAAEARSPEAQALAARREELDIDFVSEDFASALDSIREAAERVRDIQRGLRSYLAGDPVAKVPGDVNDALRATIEMLRRALPPDVRVVPSYGQLPELAFHAGKLKQVVLNLLQNAADAVGGRGTVEVTSAFVDGKVRIAICDSGPGVPEELREKIFEPYFTTKGGRGTGIGLAVCRQVAAEHGGTLRLEPSAVGAHFVIELAGEAT